MDYSHTGTDFGRWVNAFIRTMVFLVAAVVLSGLYVLAQHQEVGRMIPSFFSGLFLLYELTIGGVLLYIWWQEQSLDPKTRCLPVMYFAFLMVPPILWVVREGIHPTLLGAVLAFIMMNAFHQAQIAHKEQLGVCHRADHS